MCDNNCPNCKYGYMSFPNAVLGDFEDCEWHCRKDISDIKNIDKNDKKCYNNIIKEKEE